MKFVIGRALTILSWDNPVTAFFRKSRKLRHSLGRPSRSDFVHFEFVFTPKHGSWLNLVEGFFSKLTRQMLKGIRVKTKDKLVQRIYKYFDEVNEEPVIYHWKYKLEEIDPNEEVVVDTLPVKKSS